MKAYQVKSKILYYFANILEVLKYLVCGVLILGVIASFVYINWQVQRYFNYKLSYSDQVQKQILPITEDVKELNSKIEKLEFRIRYLEDKRIDNIK